MKRGYWSGVWMVLLWTGAQAAGPFAVEVVSPAPVQAQNTGIQIQPTAPRQAARVPQPEVNKTELPQQSKAKATAGKQTNVLGKPPALGLCDGS